MTQFEFLTAVANGTINEDVIAKANEMIVAHNKGLDKAHDRAANKRAEKMAERQPIIDALVNALDDEPKSATDLIAAAGIELAPQAVSTYFRLYVSPDVFVKEDMKGPKGKIVGYKRA